MLLFSSVIYPQFYKPLVFDRDNLFKEYKAEKEKEVEKENRELIHENIKKKYEDQTWYHLDEDKVKGSFDKDISSKKVIIILCSILAAILLTELSRLSAIKIIESYEIYCPYCYNTVLKSQIVPFICPFCKTENKSFSSLYIYCDNGDCKSVIPAVPCPTCKEQIDLLSEYNKQKIIEKRYGKKTKI